MTKADVLLQALNDGWVPMYDLTSRTGWQAHSIRSGLSTLAKKRGIAIERKREHGVTSYRLQAEEKPFS